MTSPRPTAHWPSCVRRNQTARSARQCLPGRPDRGSLRRVGVLLDPGDVPVAHLQVHGRVQGDFQAPGSVPRSERQERQKRQKPRLPAALPGPVDPASGTGPAGPRPPPGTGPLARCRRSRRRGPRRRPQRAAEPPAPPPPGPRPQSVPGDPKIRAGRLAEQPRHRRGAAHTAARPPGPRSPRRPRHRARQQCTTQAAGTDVGPRPASAAADLTIAAARPACAGTSG